MPVDADAGKLRRVTSAGASRDPNAFAAAIFLSPFDSLEGKMTLEDVILCRRQQIAS